MGNGHQSSHPVVLIEYANAYNLFLSPASTTSPHACSSRLLLQVISLLHSPEALQHASTPACVTSTLHCSIIQQYHCVSSNVLHCTTLHCTALPVCLHTARRRQKEGEKRKKKTLPVSLVHPTTTTSILTNTATLGSTWPRLPPSTSYSYSVKLGQPHRAPHYIWLFSPLPPHAGVLV